MKPEQLSQHLRALFQGWVTCPGAGKMQYNILRTLVEKNPAASQIASLQPSGPRLALGGGRTDGIFIWGTGQGSCSPLPTIHVKLLTMPETLQIIEDKKQNGSLPTKSLILPSQDPSFLSSLSAFLLQGEFSFSSQKTNTSTHALDPMPFDPGTVLFSLSLSSSPSPFFTRSLNQHKERCSCFHI